MNSGGHRGSHMHMHMHMRMCHVPKSHLVSEFDRFYLFIYLAWKANYPSPHNPS